MGCWNIGGWTTPKVVQIAEMGLDIVAVQETWLDRVSMESAKRTCAGLEMKLLHGPPVIPKKGRVKGRSGGVGFVAKTSMPFKPKGGCSPGVMRIEAQGRMAMVVLPPSDDLPRGLHIISIYAPVRGDKSRDAFTNDLWDAVMEWDMGIPTLLLGDFNGTSPESPSQGHTASQLMTKLVGPGGPFIDIHHHLAPGLVTWTYTMSAYGGIHHTHIDYVLANRAALPLVKGVGAEWRECGHTPLWVELELKVPQLLFAQPSRILPDVLQLTSSELLANEGFTKTLGKWQKSTEFKELDQRWKDMDVHELSSALQSAMEKLVAVAGGWKTKSRSGNAAYESKSIKKKRRGLAMLRSLMAELALFRKPGRWPSKVALKLIELEKNGFQLAKDDFEVLAKSVRENIATLKKEIFNETRTMMEERKKRWKDSVHSRWKKNPKQVYRWLRNEPARWWNDPMVMANGQLPKDEKEADAEMRRFWVNGVLRKNKPEEEDINWERFTASDFGSHLPVGDWSFTEWSGRRVLEVLKEMKESAAPGHRGIPLAVWKALPEACYEWIARLLQLVEEGHQWPEECLKAYVAILPKGEAVKGPNDYRPITVMDVVYRVWAKGKVMDWQKDMARILSPGVFGFREGHSGSHLSQMVQDLIYAAEDERSELRLCSFDTKKCYDSIPWWMLFGVMGAAGFPESVVGPFRAFYRDLRRRFRYGRWDGEEWTATNGMAQGCPASPDLLNLLYETFQRWAREQGLGYVVRCGDKGLQIPSASFADDLTLVARSWPEMSKLIEAFLRWCALLGLQVNVDKTQVWTNLKKAKSVDIQGTRVEIRRTYRVVGMELGGSNVWASTVHIKTRVEKAVVALQRLRALIVPSDIANGLWKCGILPMVTYGAEVVDVRGSQVRKVEQMARAVVLSKPPFKVSSFRAAEVVTGPPLGKKAVEGVMKAIRRKQWWWSVTLANSTNLAGVVHRMVCTRSNSEGGVAWKERSVAVQAMTKELGATLRINTESVLIEEWPVVKEEERYRGEIKLLPSTTSPTPRTVWTDGSLNNGRGGAAAVNLDQEIHLMASVPTATSSTECELIGLGLAGEMAPDRVLTDSMTSLQLIKNWPSYNTKRRLGCKVGALVRETTHRLNGCEQPPVLEKVKAHDTDGIASGDVKAIGNDAADMLAKRAIAEGAEWRARDKFDFPVQMCVNGSPVSDVDETFFQRWWTTNLGKLAMRRKWLADVLNVPADWAVSNSIMDEVGLVEHNVVRWVGRLRCGALSTAARWNKQNGGAPCRWCRGEIDNERHILFSCKKMGSDEWLAELQECWRIASESSGIGTTMPPSSWWENNRWQLRFAMAPLSVRDFLDDGGEFKKFSKALVVELAKKTTQLLAGRASRMLEEKSANKGSVPAAWETWRSSSGPAATVPECDMAEDDGGAETSESSSRSADAWLRWHAEAVRKLCGEWTRSCQHHEGMTSHEALELAERRLGEHLKKSALPTGVMERSRVLVRALVQRLDCATVDGESRWPIKSPEKLKGARWVVEQLVKEGNEFKNIGVIRVLNKATREWIANHPHLQPVDPLAGEPTLGLLCLWEADFGIELPSALREIRQRAKRFAFMLNTAAKRNEEVGRWLRSVDRFRPVSPGYDGADLWWSVKVRKSAGEGFAKKWREGLREWGAPKDPKSKKQCSREETKEKQGAGANSSSSSTPPTPTQRRKRGRSHDQITGGTEGDGDCESGPAPKRGGAIKVRSGRASTMDAP